MNNIETLFFPPTPIFFITIISISATSSRKRCVAKRDDILSLEGFSVPLTFDPNVIKFFATIQVGVPPTNYSALVDTGSSVLVLGIADKFVASSTTNLTGQIFASEFAAGTVFGVGATDTIHLAPGLVITNQTIGIVGGVSPASLTQIPAILGIGPTSEGTFFPGGGQVNTVVDTAVAEEEISEKVVGIFLQYPASLDPSDLQHAGTLTFGGVDSDLFCGDLEFKNRSLTPTSEPGWVFDSSTVLLGNSILTTNTTLVFDTGSGLIQLPDDAFKKYVEITGAVIDDQGLLHFSPSQALNIPSLDFDVGGFVLSLPGSDQIVPAQLLAAVGNFAPGELIGLVGGNNASEGDASDSVLIGQPLLTHYYSVFDSTRDRIGFAPSVNSRGCSQ